MQPRKRWLESRLLSLEAGTCLQKTEPKFSDVTPQKTNDAAIKRCHVTTYDNLGLVCKSGRETVGGQVVAT